MSTAFRLFFPGTLAQALCIYSFTQTSVCLPWNFWPLWRLWHWLWAGSGKSYLLSYVENLYKAERQWLSLSVWSKKAKPHRYPPEALHLKSVQLLICAPRSNVCIFSFPVTTKAERSSGAMSPMTQNPRHHFFFVSPLTLDYVRDRWQFPPSYSNPVVVFVCMVPLLRCPFWSHLLWEDLHFLSLYYALILVSYYLW